MYAKLRPEMDADNSSDAVSFFPLSSSFLVGFFCSSNGYFGIWVMIYFEFFLSLFKWISVLWMHCF